MEQQVSLKPSLMLAGGIGSYIKHKILRTSQVDHLFSSLSIQYTRRLLFNLPVAGQLNFHFLIQPPYPSTMQFSISSICIALFTMSTLVAAVPVSSILKS